MSLHDLHALPGVTATPDAATANFVFNHTMLRVKDIEKSLDFYTRVLGFSLVDKRDFPEAAFSLYFRHWSIRHRSRPMTPSVTSG